MATHMLSRAPRRRGRSPSVRPAGLVALLAVVLATASACNNLSDRLLSVTTPSRLGEGQYLVPQNADLIVAGAANDFTCALNGYVVASGMASGEFYDASQTAARWSYDRRNVLPGDARYATDVCQNLGVYTPISTARYTADQALTKLNEWTDAEVPDRAKLQGTAALYAGFSYILLAEGFCEATVNVGPLLSTTQLLDSAEARFTTAINSATATGDQTTLNAAYVGRARARLDKGDKTGAASDAAKVPLDFKLVTNADASVPARANRVFAENNNNNNNGVTVAVAYRTLTVQGQPDPRVVVIDANRTAGDQVNRIFRQTKYASLDTPLPIATGIEAKLILAEAQGASGGGVATINALRARPGVALPPLTAAEQADFQNTVYSERSRELFLQGNRWFDLRRGNLPLVPATNTPYPKGGSYGDQRCWPLPDVERFANPNLGG
jgi:hypothetical protein